VNERQLPRGENAKCGNDGHRCDVDEACVLAQVHSTGSSFIQQGQQAQARHVDPGERALTREQKESEFLRDQVAQNHGDGSEDEDL
jgi:hypothetical protein